jgi:hypothetical protein
MKSKGKVTGRDEAKLHSFLTSALHGGEWPVFTLRPFRWGSLGSCTRWRRGNSHPSMNWISVIQL